MLTFLLLHKLLKINQKLFPIAIGQLSRTVLTLQEGFILAFKQLFIIEFGCTGSQLSLVNLFLLTSTSCQQQCRSKKKG